MTLREAYDAYRDALPAFENAMHAVVVRHLNGEEPTQAEIEKLREARAILRAARRAYFDLLGRGR
jgi:hypothetical protein